MSRTCIEKLQLATLLLLGLVAVKEKVKIYIVFQIYYVPSLNTQSRIKGLLVVRNFCF